MALGVPTLATPTVGAGGVGITTASFSPTLGALLIALGGCRASALPGELTLNPSALTWTPLVAGLFDDGAAPRIRARAWAAEVSAASAMTVQVTSTGAGKCALAIVQITGAGGLPSNYQSANSAGADPTVVLSSAPAASSTVIGWYAAAGANAVTPPAGFTELDDQVFSADFRIQAIYDAASAATSTSWSSTNTNGVGILIEVQEASGATRAFRPRNRRFSHMMVR